MTRIQFDLPNELLEIARANAAVAGFATVETYASVLFQEELRSSDEALELLSLERAGDPRPGVADASSK